MPFWIIIIFQIFPLLSQLRLFRTLPVSTINLAILLVFLPIVSTLAMGAGYMALVLSAANIGQCLSLVGSFLVMSAVVAACVPIAVCLGYRLQTKMFLAIFMVIGGVMLVQLVGIQFSVSFCAVIWILTVTVSCFLTKLALTRSSNAYRAWPNPYGGGWNWGGNWGG